MAAPSEMPAAAPIPALGLASYQEGSVVSRTLLKRAGGTITLFAFDEGQSLSEQHGAVRRGGAGPGRRSRDHHRRHTAQSAGGGAGADACQSAARGACAHTLQDAVDDDPVGLTAVFGSVPADRAKCIVGMAPAHAEIADRHRTGVPDVRGSSHQRVLGVLEVCHLHDQVALNGH